MESNANISDENTDDRDEQSRNTDTNPNQESWKSNLSKRWSKKQPTKGELCDTFLDMKHSLTVQSNNTVGLNKRIERLEQDVADLIRYINARI